MNERHTIRRLKQGDIQGLESLVRVYQVEATRVAYLITRDAVLAEDVMQSAFVQAYERIDQFDESRPFAPWFFRIVANAALKAMRRSHVSLDQQAISLVEIMPDALPGPEEALTVQEMQSVVWDALSRLSPEQRAVVVMRYYLGLTESQMAEQLDRPIGTVRWRIHAAHQKLRQMLGRWNAISEPQDVPMTGVIHHE